MENLTTVIEDALTDATLVPEPVEVSTDLAPSDPIEVAPEATSAPVDPIPDTTTQVASPSASKPVQDDFEKKYGLQAQSASGRENRIPYSRVKRIADNAVKDAKTAWQKEVESGFVPTTKYQELDTRVKAQDIRLSEVAQFEKVMTSEPVRFLQQLATLPQYAEIFARLTAQAQPEVPATPAPLVPEDMPQPDQELSDGSRVYSMEGVAKLNAWNRAQGKKETMQEVEARIKSIEARYAPLENDYKQHQVVQQIMPKVQQQIADARTWPLFNESEAEIVAVLQKFPAINLERAYQQVVFPKLQANRDQMRASILKEVKQAPRSTAASSSVTRSSPTTATAGPRKLEDIIADSIKLLK